LGSAALSEAGEGFEIGCSYGSALAPADTSRPEQMLHLADQRMYSTKAGRSSASRQSTDVLLQVLSERNSELGDHLNAVAALAEPVARRLGLSAAEVNRTQTAAQLHDVGKSGIPDAILGKKGPLDEEEWKFMHRHTLIGERIILAAPSLAPAAELVRSSHERYDGEGYPDHLAGDEIPPGSRIIAVCDAFQAMTAERPYRGAISVAEALAELRRCAGTQFDPVVVDEVCAQVEERQAASNGSGAPSPLALRT
ncbi:MAG: HD domain-containing protein, partial [Actinomycetota bacterium]|nr:HD domain-containing protein [Actinomycetota bacterium]